MAERNICSVDLLQTMSENTNVIVDENGTLNKLNIYNEFNSVNTKIDNEIDTVNERVSQLSNPNLLINSDFRNPVNQRGATSYSSVDGSYTCVYSIDRWRLQLGCCLAVNDGSITLTSSRTSGTCGFQYVPENVYYEDDYTIQVNVKSLSGDANLTVYASGAKVMLQEILSVGDNVFNIKNSDIMLIQINITTSTTIELEYIKLEQGSIATPFVPRLYAEEVALVEYYMMTYQGALGIAHISSTTIAFVTIPCNTRAIPTINEANVILHCSGTNYDGITKMVNVNSDDNTIAIQINGTFPSSIVGQSAFTFMNGDTLTLDAEIY